MRAGLEGMRVIPLSYINKSDAIIILEGSNPDHMGTKNQARFDYKAFNKPPKEFLESIIDPILKHQETMALLNLDVKKTLFFGNSCLNNNVPKEVSSLVLQHLANDYSFFSKPEQPVYVKLPQQPQPQSQQQEGGLVNSFLKLMGFK